MCRIRVAPRYLLFEHKYFNTVFCTEPTVLKMQLYKTLHLAFTVDCFKGPSSFLLSPLHFPTVYLALDLIQLKMNPVKMQKSR